jgi:Ras-related protein Rab-5C
MSCNENKIVFVGQSGVGKSSILERFTQNTFTNYTESTIGASFAVGTIQKNGKSLKLGIWDTAGQERYDSLVPLYYRDAKVGVVVYDITSSDSFEKAKYWLENLKINEPAVKCIVVGTKIDLETSRKVDYITASTFAFEESALFIEISAKTPKNMTLLFDKIGDLVIEYNNFMKISPKLNIRKPEREFYNLHTRNCCSSS